MPAQRTRHAAPALVAASIAGLAVFAFPNRSAHARAHDASAANVASSPDVGRPGPPPTAVEADHSLADVEVVPPTATAAVQAEDPVTDSPGGPAPTVQVAASKRYTVGRLHRFTFGGGYRDLWEQEIELPVLQLKSVGGGLKPVGRFGGLQSAVLSFQGADGRSYTFRGTDKDPSAVLDPALRGTVVQSVVQDQMAAQHPAGPVAAGILTEAAGVLTVRPRMVVMPDDPALGEYREEFAGMVGVFFVYPQPRSDEQPGFHGATEIIDYKELYGRLKESNSTEVDVEALLRARLVDVLLGDFDRHRKQWRWAKLPGDARWQPIPEDRDQAFVRFTGLVPALARMSVPILQRYDKTYPAIKGLTLHGWEQDRWLLAQLSWSDWEPIVTDLQARLSDDVIDRAIAAMPPEYAAVDKGRLRKHIIGRRDRLPKAARRFYEHLALEVDVQTSNASDTVKVERMRGGHMRIRVHAGADGGTPDRLVYERTFHPSETKEVRLILRGGDDAVTVTGRNRRIRLRVTGDGGSKTLDDSEAGGTRVYDSQGDFDVAGGFGTRIKRRPYTPPGENAGFVDVEDVPPRDWKSDTTAFPDLGFQPDVGVFLGASITHTRYAFRRDPWASKHRFSAGYATQAQAPRVSYRGLFRAPSSPIVGGLDVQFSGIELLRFYGFGNETLTGGEDAEFRVRNEQTRAFPSLTGDILDGQLSLTAGPYLAFSRTRSGDRLIDRQSPYGSGNFGQIGAEASVRLDTRETIEVDGLLLPFNSNPAAGFPTGGVLIDLAARYSPPVWDVEKSYSTIFGSAALFAKVTKDARVTIAARVGGERNFGSTPYFDRAAIGGGRFFQGSSTNRGFRPRRFAGDASVYSNADVRVFLARVKLVVPGDVGVHGFGDVGRVFLDSEISNDWHASGGGGLWFSPLVRPNTLSVSLAHSSEDTLVYVRLGFHY